MSTAWQASDLLEDDTDVSDESPQSGDEVVGEYFFGTVSRCHTFKAWREVSGDVDIWSEWSRVVERTPLPAREVIPPIALATWNYCESAETLRSRLWEAVHALREAVEELLAEPPPKRQDREGIAIQLDAYLDQLAGLRHRLPREDDLDSVDAGAEPDEGTLAVDWRLLNQTQLGGWASPIRDENGSLLMAYRPASYGRPIAEVEDDEPFIE